MEQRFTTGTQGQELFRKEQQFVDDLFAQYPDTQSLIGAFEGANYAATGYYRPAMNCTMFTRHDEFCQVCQRAIEDVISLYTR